MSQVQISTHKKQAVLDTANALLKSQNRVTTLEIKTSLRANATYAQYYWDQAIVSAIMIELQKEGKFDYVDTGVYRIYSGTPAPVKKVRKAAIATPTAAPAPPAQPAKAVTKKVAAVRISRKRALELMSTNKGHFFTATFEKKDGTTRTINCQYLKDQTNSDLGYVKVKEAGLMKKGEANPVRQVNLQTLKALTIAKQAYVIR